MTSADSRRLLDGFLADNPDLERLSARLSEFNLFRVLRAEHAELRHSNILAWLLTPGEAHGLGSQFVRRFLSRLLLENEDVPVSLTPARVELMRLDDIEVRREWLHIDVAALSHSNRWGLLIENKVWSRESAGQLRRYLQAARDRLPGYELIPVLLTLRGDEPSDEGSALGYVPIDYSQLIEIADGVIRQHSSKIPSDARVLLDHYMRTVRRLTVEDTELVDLCKAIYRRHREAIDLIVDLGASSQVLDACEASVRELASPDFLVKTSNRVWFVPPEMERHLREVTLDGWGHLSKRYPVMWWFFYRRTDGHFQVSLEVGPIADPGLRVRLLTKFQRAGFQVSERALQKGRRYTRILTESKKFEQQEDGGDEDPEAVREATASLWRKAWSKGNRVVDVLSGFNWAPTDPG